ncbi:YaaL family protein [Carnobacterium gallinarum]|uniref:YaaL family protein n=1 Tax=Carnobacterium gallinarum TaxID=2749 RepID=UPI000555992B|nr:YaaL family protein [Carnobacterium gallinarum]
MVFGRRKKGLLRKEYDEELLELMYRTKDEWEYKKGIEDSVFDKDGLLFSQTKLAEAKYFYLFKEARIREIKSTKVR